MNGLTAEAKKIIRRWCRSDYYVYIRPLSGVYFNEGNEKVVWVVNVEVRALPPIQVRKEGTDLSEVITQLDLLVPRHDKGYVVEKPHHYSGWLAPCDEPRPRVSKTDPGEPEGIKRARPVGHLTVALDNHPKQLRSPQPRRKRRGSPR